MAPWLGALRPHQWIKNTLVALPAVAAHRWNQPLLIPAFVCFCLASSAVYIVNDILDARQDRKHPGKRKRPIESGKLSVRAALLLFAALCSASIIISVYFGFNNAIGTYFIVACGYCIGNGSRYNR